MVKARKEWFEEPMGGGGRKPLECMAVKERDRV